MTETVLYVQSIDELTDRLDLSISSPVTGPDWGLLVSETDGGHAVVWLESEVRVVLSDAEYTAICDDEFAQEHEINSPVERVAQSGADAIMDVKNGVPPLDGVENALGRAVAEAYAAKYVLHGARALPA